MILLDITLPQLPPSINAMYATVGGRRVKSEQAKDFSKLAADRIQLENRGFAIPLEARLEFFLVCFYPKMELFGKNDSDSRLKAAKDSVFDASLLADETSLKRANDNQVLADHCYKSLGLDATKPQGYCRIILAEYGRLNKVISVLGVL